MGQDHKPTDFESAKVVLEVLGKTVQLFDVDGGGNQSLKTWLDPMLISLLRVQRRSGKLPQL
jgi:hypothetical protein